MSNLEDGNIDSEIRDKNSAYVSGYFKSLSDLYAKLPSDAMWDVSVEVEISDD